tara:strand:- start:65 stop:580 length:516 start_codon:yes stop_codon:yes gene_type:complete
MFILKYAFFGLILFSNLSYSNDNNQLIFHEPPKNHDKIILNALDKKAQIVNPKDKGIFIINFWATWCPPCIKEIPQLLNLQKGNAKYIDLFFISMDFNIDAVMPKFIKKNKFDNMLIFDDSNMKLSEQLDVKILPTTLILDNSLRELARVEGYIDWNTPRNRNVLNDILSK